MARRQGRLILADRGYFIFLALLPFVLAGLVLSVPGSAGFNVALPDNPNEPGLLLALTNLGASFLGLALTIRDLIGERVIFRREQACPPRPTYSPRSSPTAAPPSCSRRS
ncbi:Putative ABC transporter, ATP-binding protein [Mycobacteroides abscessus subsp. abscessus]|nr:Putative ABC transporter, ATP-binding protein [Mycobacteroides abscessus subsp. abscessus]